MEQKPKVFADGFSFKRQENAPAWVIGRQSVKVDEAIAFLKQHQKPKAEAATSTPGPVSQDLPF